MIEKGSKRSRARMPRYAFPWLAAAVASAWLPVSAQAWGVTLRSVSELDESVTAAKSTSTYASAEEMKGTVHDVLHLIGNAEIRRGGSVLKGDRISYTQATDEVRASGKVLLAKDGAVFSGEEASYRIDAQTGAMPNAEYTFTPRGLRGCAGNVEFIDGSHLKLSNATITSCPKGSKAWWIEIEQLDLDEGEQTAEGRWASLHLAGTKIAGFPWFEFPVGVRRKSGLLTPSLGVSSRKGLQIKAPIYWNIAPNYDYTFTPHLMGRRGLMLGNEFRYLQPNYSGKINYDWMYRDQQTKDRRYGLHFEHLYKNGGFFAGANYNRVSDKDYVEDYSGSIREASENVLNQDFWLGYGRGIWTASLRVTKNQILETFNDDWQPYERVPQFTFSAYKGDFYGLEYTGKVEATRFRHLNRNRPEGSRFVIDQKVSYPLRGSYWYAEPSARWIGTWYSVNGSQPKLGDQALERSASRSLPIFSMDAGLILDRETSWFGHKAEQTLEPRLFYAYIPYKDQSRLPVFDTTASDLNITQLFQENIFSGYDRISESNQLTAALTTRYLDSSTGIEWFRGTVGQRFYFADQRVGLPNYNGERNEGIRTDSKSDLLGSVGVRLTKTLTADGTIQYSSSESRVSKAYAGIRWNPRPASTVSLYYRYNYAPSDVYNNIKQLDFAVQWPLSEHFYVVGRYNYSFRKRNEIEALGGIEYHADCWTLRTVAQRYITSSNKYDTTFYVQLELNGLGSIGTNPLSELRDSIPGYQSRSPVPSVTGRYEYYE